MTMTDELPGGSRAPRLSQMRPVPPEKEDPSLPDSVNKVNIEIDPTEELLQLGTVDPSKITAEVDMSPWLKAKWVVRALDDDLNDRLVAEATQVLENPRTRQQARQMDTAEYARLIIYHCVVKPDLKDPRVADKHKLSTTQHVRIVKAVLKLPGYADRVSSKIMEISGFSDQYINVAKNSLREEG